LSEFCSNPPKNQAVLAIYYQNAFEVMVYAAYGAWGTELPRHGGGFAYAVMRETRLYLAI